MENEVASPFVSLCFRREKLSPIFIFPAPTSYDSWDEDGDSQGQVTSLIIFFDLECIFLPIETTP